LTLKGDEAVGGKIQVLQMVSSGEREERGRMGLFSFSYRLQLLAGSVGKRESKFLEGKKNLGKMVEVCVGELGRFCLWRET
jgi:hypothetical protein